MSLLAWTVGGAAAGGVTGYFAEPASSRGTSNSMAAIPTAIGAVVGGAAGLGIGYATRSAPAAGRHRTRLNDPHAWDASVASLERNAGVGPSERAAWDRAAARGACDSRGGAEYRRWLAERAHGSRMTPAQFGRDALIPPRHQQPSRNRRTRHRLGPVISI